MCGLYVLLIRNMLAFIPLRWSTPENAQSTPTWTWLLQMPRLVPNKRLRLLDIAIIINHTNHITKLSTTAIKQTMWERRRQPVGFFVNYTGGFVLCFVKITLCLLNILRPKCFRRWHFHIYFLDRKRVNFDANFNEVCFSVSKIDIMSTLVQVMPGLCNNFQKLCPGIRQLLENGVLSWKFG